MARVIFENELIDLALSLAERTKVFVPAKKNPGSTFGQYSFCEVTKETITAFDYPTTILPPKEFLLPAKEILFGYKDSKIESTKNIPQVIFGVSLEDLEGIDRLSTLFNKPVKDEAFANKREQTVVIGLDHFSPPQNVEFDLYLQKINREMYVGIAKTKKGQEILKNPLFKTQSISVPRVSKRKDPILANPELPKIIEKSKDHPVWQEMADVCFGCGICSYVCPLCYCFETEDSLDMIEKSTCGERCRTWDSCMLKSFAETNVKNFRPELADRIYNWYFHKFVRMPAEYKFSGCVDCNRCIIYCPAKINYHTTLTRLVRDWEAKK